MESFAAQLLSGPYRWPAFDVEAWAVRTNRFGSGSYRAPSGPQGTFALESLMDELAERLGLDPVDLRLANLVAEGDEMAGGERWPGIGVRECL
jgi:CO/xanthine dehydrogenase Mo-binding subunit